MPVIKPRFISTKKILFPFHPHTYSLKWTWPNASRKCYTHYNNNKQMQFIVFVFVKLFVK